MKIKYDMKAIFPVSLNLSMIYLQFISFNVATAICVISPPCLEEIRKTQEIFHYKVFLSTEHTKAVSHSDLHFFPTNKSSPIDPLLAA